MTAAVPQPKANMGDAVPRLYARPKVTGEARYGSDFALNNPAFAFLLTSAIAKGRITKLDLTEAKAVPGVLDILTHENVKELKHLKYSPGGGGPSTSIQGFGPEIAHDGQIIGMVVADTFEAAREAAYRVKVTYDEHEPSATFESPGTVIEDAAKVSPVHKEKPKAGDADAVLASAATAIDVEYGTPTQH